MTNKKTVTISGKSLDVILAKAEKQLGVPYEKVRFKLKPQNHASLFSYLFSKKTYEIEAWVEEQNVETHEGAKNRQDSRKNHHAVSSAGSYRSSSFSGKIASSHHNGKSDGHGEIVKSVEDYIKFLCEEMSGGNSQ